MRRPDPKPGLVIRYDFLWNHEAAKGWQDGAKDRPCIIVQAVKQVEDNKQAVLLAPITHTPPGEHNGIEIPHSVAKHIGLDDQGQWIKTDALNRVSWDDPGIIPANKKQWEYGRLPKWLYDQIRTQIQKNARDQKIQVIKRDVD